MGSLCPPLDKKDRDKEWGLEPEQNAVRRGLPREPLPQVERSGCPLHTGSMGARERIPDLTVILFPVSCCHPYLDADAIGQENPSTQCMKVTSGHRALEKGRAWGGPEGQTEDISFPCQLQK